MTEAPNPPPQPTEAQLCAYVAEVAAELRDLVRGHAGLRTLAYLLDMARMEAERMGRETAG